VVSQSSGALLSALVWSVVILIGVRMMIHFCSRRDDASSVIYVRLLNDGVGVLRPTRGTRIYGDVYLLKAPTGYDSRCEKWEFPPGTNVVCAREIHSGSEIIIAKRVWEESANFGKN
jgi:hypothetical protein